MSRKVIDLSVWNSGSPIDWKTVKENIDGIILRIGYRGYGRTGSLKTDPKFKEFAANCVKYDIPFGVYWFAQEITEKESVETAKYIAKLLANYKIEYPVYYDVEYSGAKNNTGRADGLNVNKRTACTIAFCEEIKKLGYIPGIYANEEWYTKKLNFNKIKKYNIWCARWNDDNGNPSTPPIIKYDIWQYTSRGLISGIKGYVDISLDESTLVDTSITCQSIDEVANDVINGKYGNGQARKDALIKAGYDYDEVQFKVNEILGLDSKLSVLIEGDTVKLSKNAVYTNGNTIPQWIKDSILYVRNVKEDNSVIISTLKSGAITGTVHKKYLTKI